MKKLITSIAIMATVMAGSASALGPVPVQAEMDTYTDAVVRGNDHGLTKFESRAHFRGDAAVTREQAAKMMSVWLAANHQLEWPVWDENCTFEDQAEIDETLANGVDMACKFGLFKGYKGDFMPKRYLTTTDMYTIIERATDILPAYSAYMAELPSLEARYLTRGELIKGLFRINAIVKAKMDAEKDNELSSVQTELDASMQLWASKNIVSYTAEQQAMCFCPPAYTNPIRFDVEENVAVKGSIQDISEENALPAEEVKSEAKTVTDLFAIIQDAIDRRADDITVNYDAQLGYPTSISIDYNTMIADEEMYYTYKIVSQN